MEKTLYGMQLVLIRFFRCQDVSKWKEIDSQVKVNAILLTVDKEIATKRNLGRERQVPLEVIARMNKQLIEEPIDTELDKFDNVSM